ncbi:MAG: CsgG/HfaB family protein [Proteobacteria bacterium]|nr:CsgG/HfaB family protein [Pseudomonadota bacterium]
MYFSSNQKYNIRSLKYFSYCIVIFILCLFFLSGCFFLPSPNRFLKNDFEEYKIRRIAVLPFYNGSTTKAAGGIVTKAFIEELYDSGKFEIEFPGNVEKFIVGERIIIRKGIGADHIKVIGERLNVDAIIIGCVKKYESEGKKNAQIPVISVDARMIHADSCSILWLGDNYRRGDDYETFFGIGRIISLADLSREVVKELIDTIP